MAPAESCRRVAQGNALRTVSGSPRSSFWRMGGRGDARADTRFHFRTGVTSVVRAAPDVRKRLPVRAVRLPSSWLLLACSDHRERPARRGWCVCSRRCRPHDESVALLATTEQRRWAIRRTSAPHPLRREIHQLMSSVCRTVVRVRRPRAEPDGSGNRLWVYPPVRAARTLCWGGACLWGWSGVSAA